jgi:hypothetical protein
LPKTENFIQIAAMQKYAKPIHLIGKGFGSEDLVRKILESINPLGNTDANSV